MIRITSAAAEVDRFAPDFGDPAVDDQGCATAALVRVDVNGLYRAVSGAGPTLHAPVVIDDCGFFVLQLEYSVRADGNAHAAANARFLVEFENGGAVNISEVFHDISYFIKGAAIHRLTANSPHTHWTGRPRRISFSTPESEV